MFLNGSCSHSPHLNALQGRALLVIPCGLLQSLRARPSTLGHTQNSMQHQRKMMRYMHKLRKSSYPVIIQMDVVAAVICIKNLWRYRCLLMYRIHSWRTSLLEQLRGHVLILVIPDTGLEEFWAWRSRDVAQGQHSLILHDSCTVGPSLCIQIEGIFCKKKCEDVAAERKDASLNSRIQLVLMESNMTRPKSSLTVFLVSWAVQRLGSMICWCGDPAPPYNHMKYHSV